MRDLKFGVISDIQYADIPDGFSFSGEQKRFYRGALDGLKLAVKDFNTEGVDFVLQLGDIIDGQNAANFGPLKGKEPISESSLQTVMEIFETIDKKIPVYHSIGNHELYNFNWKELSLKLNNKAKNYKISDENERFYFSFTNPIDETWKIIQLNPYELTLMQNKNEKGFEGAKKILQKNPNFDDFYPEFDPDLKVPETQCDFFKDCKKDELHFSPFNGGLGKVQLNWLENELKEAKKLKQKVILLSHIPLHRGENEDNSKTLAFDFEEVQELILKVKGTVKLVLSGHNHSGGYHYCPRLEASFLVLQAPLVFGTAHGIITLTKNEIIIEGKGGVPSRKIPISTSL